MSDTSYQDVVDIVDRSNQVHDGGALRRLSTLSKKLSRRSTRSEVGKFEYDPEDFDLAKMLKALKKNSEEQGIHLRNTGVVLEDVTTYGVDASASFATTVQDILMGPLSIFRKIKEGRNQKNRKLIRDFVGIVEPGEMCLVLGKPGAGCSTLLRTVAGEHDQFVKVEGDISYDGIPQHEMIKHFKNDVIYNGELEFHFPHLTVDQTLTFAIACKTPETRVDSLTREQYISSMKQMLATILGLTHTYNTKVGNDFIRGVSGGERKRVSIAEAMATRASVFCWDNATRGLDASNALEFVSSIRTQTSIMNTVAFVTVYQAGENIYNSFDKVSVLYDGYQIYFGPVDQAKQYFEEMGYVCPKRQSTPEFLTAVTDPIGRFAKEGYESKVPNTPKEFAEYWQQSSYYKALLEEISDYKANAHPDQTRELFDKSSSQEQKKPHNHYTISYASQVKLLTKRSFQRIYGDKAFTLTHTIAAIIQALISGSLYYQTPSSTSGAFSRGGVLFYMVLYFSLMGLAEISTHFEMRPILLKQRSYSLYHLSAEAFASNLSRFPFQMISVLAFYIIFYFLAGLDVDVGKFFLILLFLIFSSESVVGLFSVVASVSNNVAGANAVAGLLMLGLVVYSCYMVQLNKMHPWFKWISYINPLRWGFEDMISTEFHGRKMDCGSTLVPSGTGYENISTANQVCAFVGSKTGQTWVLGDDYMDKQFSFNYTHIWRNFGFLCAFYFGFFALYCLASEYKRPVGSGGDHLYFKRTSEVKLTPVKNDIESSGDETAQEERKKLEDEQSAEEKVLYELGSRDIFAWRDLKYVIPYKGGKRTLLDGINGYVKPGTLTALMGESGAGKTTLLNTLAERNDIGVVTGEMMVNGLPLGGSFKRNTGYVQQQDLHMAQLTVRESLQFAARLRRPKSVPDHEKLEYAEQIIKILQMESYANAIVGDIGAGLNVEQRKKLSIGVELVAKPSLLLFLDEPTSGLDSQSSWAIVQLLKDLANAGQSILCTIHQPSATLFESFDRLLLLKKGGKTVYFGDIGKHSAIMLEYFERKGARKCDISENPAEYILEAIGAGANAHTDQDWSEVWNASTEAVQALKEVDEIMALKKQSAADNDEDSERTYAMPYFDQLKLVSARTALQFWRTPQYIVSKFMLMISGGLFIGFTFWDLDKSVTGMREGMFAAFLSIIISFPAMNQIQAQAVASRELFEVRESRSNTYHWSAMLIAQYLAEIPYHFLSGFCYFCCLYFPMKTNDSASRAGVFYLNYALIYQLYYISLGLFIVYSAPDLPSAAVITGLMNSMMISFCGVVQPRSLMPGFWTFMWKVSPFTYVVQNLVALVLHKKEIVCKSYELSYFEPPDGQTCYEFANPYIVHTKAGYLSNPNATSTCGYCEYKVADEFLKTVDVSYSHIWRNFGFFWVYIGFNVCALYALFYIFRVAKVSPFGFIKGFIEKRKNAREAKKVQNAEKA